MADLVYDNFDNDTEDMTTTTSGHTWNNGHEDV